ncbi:MAG: phosphoglucosamine mutase [bacterium]|nr:phosphoglucosamine mutase [bacterium]
MNRKKNNKLFGTDGIRTRFGTYPLDAASIVKLGNTLGLRLKGARINLGRDTRQSGPEIGSLLASGAGKDVIFQNCGIIPTPGLSYITLHGDFDYGIMITASHNPWEDNGIKIFAGNGEKIPAVLEKELEDIFFSLNEPTARLGATPASDVGGRSLYTDFLDTVASRLDTGKAGKFKIVLDCANGATFETAPGVFRKAGFDVVVINNTPDGKNINLDCGSTMPRNLVAQVKEHGADLGIAFDGDGDRVMMADPEGHILDGDFTLWLMAQYLQKNPQAGDFNNIVVGTVMGNLGLENALKAIGVEYLRTDVGDKYVSREMKARGAIIGGEQSGHTILSAFQNTGDGILTALFFLEALFYLKQTPAEVYRSLKLYPQVMSSFKIKEKRDILQWKELQAKIAEFNAAHGADSRILIRYSGTEPKIRVMIESEQESVIKNNLGKFEEYIKSVIG